MARQYYYCPFDSEDVDSITGQTKIKYENKGGTVCVICPPTVLWKSGAFVTINGGRGALKDVPVDAVLLIDGHGSPKKSGSGGHTAQVGYEAEAPVIIPTTGNPQLRDITALTPAKLADLLVKEELKEGHRAIRMLTCYGAGAEVPYTGEDEKKLERSKRVIAQYEVNDCFARVLAMTMRGRGYPDLCVAGYKGPVLNTPTTLGTEVMNNAGEQFDTPASTDRGLYMRWFDGTGTAVPKPTGLQSSKK